MSHDEYVDVVDENDLVIGRELRSRKSALGFISRIVLVMIADSEGRYLICKRAPHKSEGNLYDGSACGAVMAGESYDDAAKRELKEELGFDCPIRFLRKVYKENGPSKRTFAAIYRGISDDEPKLCDELSESRKFTTVELKEQMVAHPDAFCHGFHIEFAAIEDLL